jgi:formylglycine-generating enzyme required for sulfatase activity
MRAGATTSRFFGESDELLADYAWSQKNAENRMRPVGRRKPNDFGFFDSLGNAFSWCQDVLGEAPNRAAAEDRDDTVKLDRTLRRLIRGSSFVYTAPQTRTAARYCELPTIGDRAGFSFRVARTIETPSADTSKK